MTIEECLLCAREKEKTNDRIGTQQEKILHRTIKYYLCPDEKYHEIKIDGYFVDVYYQNKIEEIQTRSFNSLRKKLTDLLPNYKIEIVYPCSQKNIYKINEDTGEIVGPRKSPDKSGIWKSFVELYKIKMFLQDKNLSFRILFFEVDEYRRLAKKHHGRTLGYTPIEQIPKQLKKDLVFSTVLDYSTQLNLLSLPHEFTSKEFHLATKLSPKNSSIVLNVFTHLGCVKRTGKQKNAFIYQIVTNETKN